MSAAGQKDDFLSQLTWDKKSSREEIESDEEVREILTSDYLFDEELNETVEKLLHHKKSLMKAVSLWKGEEIEEQLEHWEESNFFELLGVFISDAFPELRDIEYENKEELNNTILEEFKNISEKCEELVHEFSSPRGLSAELLTTRAIYLCSECGKLISIDSPSSGTCRCGENISGRSDREKHYIEVLDENFESIAKDDMFLEFAMERIFRKMQFETESGVNIQGKSGIEHELDVLADDRQEQKRCLVECKAKAIGLNEIILFNQKCEDIGCDLKILATTEGLKGDREKRFAESKSILVIDNFYERDVDEIADILDTYSAVTTLAVKEKEELKKLKCDICGEKFDADSQRGMSSHLINKHDKTGKGIVDEFSSEVLAAKEL